MYHLLRDTHMTLNIATEGRTLDHPPVPFNRLNWEFVCSDDSLNCFMHLEFICYNKILIKHLIMLLLRLLQLDKQTLLSC